jgi:hypothetical protein
MEESSAAIIAAGEDSSGPLDIVSRLSKPDEVVCSGSIVGIGS